MEKEMENLNKKHKTQKQKLKTKSTKPKDWKSESKKQRAQHIRIKNLIKTPNQNPQMITNKTIQ